MLQRVTPFGKYFSKSVTKSVTDFCQVLCRNSLILQTKALITCFRLQYKRVFKEHLGERYHQMLHLSQK